MRDTSLRLPPGTTGTVVEVRVFNRHGVDKDQRAISIEREEIERLGKDRDDELNILERNIYSRLGDLLLGKKATSGPKGFKRVKLPRKPLITSRAASGGKLPSTTKRRWAKSKR
nr:hypothetical protein [Hyphobacterium sp. CCMP332]